MPTQTSPSTLPRKVPGIAKLDLSALAKSGGGRTSNKYPVLPDPSGEVAQLVKIVREEAEEFDSIKGSFDIHKAELATLATPFYFLNGAGKLEVPSSIACRNGGDEVLVTFQSRYKEGADESAIAEAMGPDYSKYVRQGFTLKIDGDLLPNDPAEAQEIVNELVAVLAARNCAAALTAKAVLKPTPDFHVRRHTIFTPDANMAINLAMPIVAAVKTKGRGR